MKKVCTFRTFGGGLSGFSLRCKYCLEILEKKVYSLGVSGMAGRFTVNTVIFSPYVTNCMLGE